MTPSTPSTQILNYPFPVSQLALFPDHTGTTLQAAQAAGLPVKPFNPNQAIQAWFDPAPADGIYNVLDTTNAAGGYIDQVVVAPAQAAVMNLPGTYAFPAYAPAPCIVTLMEGGMVAGGGDISSDVCLETDAQEIVNEIAPLYPGQTLTAILLGTGVYSYVYAAGELRREYAIKSGAQTIAGNVQALIQAKNAGGVGAPGNWRLVALPGSAYTALTWVPTPQITAAPAGAVTLPVPIRPLGPGEAIVPVTGVLPGSNAFQVVDAAAQRAAIQTQIDALEAELAALPAA
jgi:hypothetical protein